ncbi:MAG: hypothetical protein JWQ40_5212, partial [Segetibacter sp.]|nr:hypothetical protein [Segetibacter sp.]
MSTIPAVTTYLFDYNLVQFKEKGFVDHNAVLKPDGGASFNSCHLLRSYTLHHPIVTDPIHPYSFKLFNNIELHNSFT